MTEDGKEIRVFVEDTAGDQFVCEISADTKLSELAADFFDERDWPTTDSSDHGQRAVVELIDPENPDRTKRLRGDQTVEDAGLWDGCRLRIFPESIAGIVDERERIRALVADHQDMQDLVSWNSHISFEPNSSHAPTRYIVTFDYRSFSGLKADGHTPQISTDHRVEIILGADYPRRAPNVRWLTPIFHPNISPETRDVCLGVIMDRYLPGLGLARLVTMLAEMVQYRNFDMSDALNTTAAKWTLDTEHWKHIKDIGGSPLQGPVYELFKDMEKFRYGKGKRTRIKFKQLTPEENS